ncbi:MAG TPA: GPW/gp25 family protein [Candidatus Dormibacteraeota bacterium]|nr:GPW/gp25 family protein [Candidatus Dormibacteraeota bacterium]
MSSTYQDPVSWPFLPVPQGGQISYPTLAQSVRDSIRIILTTQPGEQLMRPSFGVGLQTFLDEGNTLTVRASIQRGILDGLQSYEPRIVVDRVDVDTVANAPSEVQVQIYYRLLRTNASQQIGLTMNVG